MKLTKTIKQQMIETLLSRSPLLEQAQSVVNTRAAIAESIRLKIIKQLGRSEYELSEAAELIKSQNKKFKNYLSATSTFKRSGDYVQTIHITLRGEYHELQLDGLYHQDYKYLNDPTYFNNLIKVIVQPGLFLPAYRITLLDDSDYDELIKVTNDDLKLREEVKAWRQTVSAALSSINSDKQLSEQWPEAVSAIPVTENAIQTGVSLPLDQLNKMCGL